MKLNHKQKVRKANQLLAQDERSTYYTYDNVTRRKPRTSKFASRKWLDIAEAKFNKVQTIREKAFYRKHPELIHVKDTADSSTV